MFSRSSSASRLVGAALWFSLFVCRKTTAYISPAPHSGWDPNQHKQRSMNQQQPSTVESSSKPSSSSFLADPPASIQVDDIFQEEYRDWAKRYGKKIDFDDMQRFENFKLNFMLQMQQNKKTGIFYLLNEYGDMTIKEYNNLMRKGRKIDEKRNRNVHVRSFSTEKSQHAKNDGTPSRGDKLSGVEVVEALAKTAQEYQNYLSRKSASASRSRKRRRDASPSSSPHKPKPTPKSPSGGSGKTYDDASIHKSLIEDLDKQHQQFMDGITRQPTVKSSPKKCNSESQKESNGYAVMAELVLDPPPSKTGDDQEDNVEGHSTKPRVKPPKVHAMGTSQSYCDRDATRKRPGTLESKNFQTIKGTPSNKSFFSGIGTQFVGVSSNKRLVRWEPGMEE